MKPNNSNKTIRNLSGFYQDIQPDSAALARMRAILEREKNAVSEPTALVTDVFKRYILAAAMVILVLSVALDMHFSRAPSATDVSVEQWLYSGTELDPSADISEYSLLMEL